MATDDFFPSHYYKSRLWRIPHRGSRSVAHLIITNSFHPWIMAPQPVPFVLRPKGRGEGDFNPFVLDFALVANYDMSIYPLEPTIYTRYQFKINPERHRVDGDGLVGVGGEGRKGGKRSDAVDYSKMEGNWSGGGNGGIGSNGGSVGNRKDVDPDQFHYITTFNQLKKTKIIPDGVDLGVERTFQYWKPVLCGEETT